MFKGHGLHKPNYATWAEAEGQLYRYLNQRPSGPIPPVDVAALLRKSDAWNRLWMRGEHCGSRGPQSTHTARRIPTSQQETSHVRTNSPLATPLPPAGRHPPRPTH